MSRDEALFETRNPPTQAVDSKSQGSVRNAEDALDQEI